MLEALTFIAILFVAYWMCRTVYLVAIYTIIFAVTMIYRLLVVFAHIGRGPRSLKSH